MTAKARARGRPLFQAYAVAVAASVAFGFALQSCGVSAPDDCTQKANCPADGPDSSSMPTGGPDASPVEASGVDVGVVDGTSADLSAPDGTDAITEDGGAFDVTADQSVADSVAQDGAFDAGMEETSPGDGEGGDVSVVADAKGDGADGGTADAGDAAIMDAGGDGPSPLCGSGQCPASCAVASVILQITSLPGSSGSFATTASACVLFHGSVSGWGVSNADGRTVTAIGATTFGPTPTSQLNVPPAIAASADGFIYWIFTPGTQSFASMFIF